MHKLFSLKLITKNPSKFTPKPFKSNPISHPVTNNVTPNYHHHHHHGFYSLPQAFQGTPTNCLIKLLSNPVRFNGVLAKFKGFVGQGGFGSLRDQFRRHGFQFNQPVSYKQTWLVSYADHQTVFCFVVYGLVCWIMLCFVWLIVCFVFKF